MQARLADAQEQLLAVTNRLAEQQSAPLPQNASQSEADTFAKMMSLQRLVNDLEAQNASTAHTLRSHSVDAVPSNVSSVLNGNASSGECLAPTALLLHTRGDGRLLCWFALCFVNVDTRVSSTEGTTCTP